MRKVWVVLLCGFVGCIVGIVLWINTSSQEADEGAGMGVTEPAAPPVAVPASSVPTANKATHPTTGSGSALIANKVTTPSVPGTALIHNGFEPDDNAPLTSLEEQVRNNLIEERIEFSKNDITVTHRGDYDYIEVKDALRGVSAPGSPDLPIYHFSLLIPRGRVIESVNFKVSEVPWRQNVRVAPTQPPQRADGSPRQPFVPPVESVYAGQGFLPALVVHDSGGQGIRGYTVVPVKVSPVRYDPSSGELTRVTSLKVEISTRAMTSQERKNAFMPKSNEHFDRSVKSIVSNPGIMDIQVVDL